MATGEKNWFSSLGDFISGKKDDSSPRQSSSPDSDITAGRVDLASLKTEGKQTTKTSTGDRQPRASKAQETLKQIQLAETLEKLYDPKNFKPVGKLYFNVRYGTTGWDGFLLTPAEEETIAASLAMLTEALWLWDPRLLALIIAGGNIGSIVAQKEIAFSNLKRAARASTENGQRKA